MPNERNKSKKETQQVSQNQLKRDKKRKVKKMYYVTIPCSYKGCEPL